MCLLRLESLFPTASGAPESKPHFPPKLNVWMLLVPAQDPRATQCGAQTSCSLGRTSAIVVILSLVGHSHRDMSLDSNATPRSYPSRCSFFFISLVVEGLFL